LPAQVCRLAYPGAGHEKDCVFLKRRPDLTLYEIDVDGAALTKRNTVTLPANIQYAWAHPSRQYFYVVSSNGGPGVEETGTLPMRSGLIQPRAR